jgi:hypothetical protein
MPIQPDALSQNATRTCAWTSAHASSYTRTQSAGPLRSVP